MLFGAMFLDTESGIPAQAIVFAIAITGMVFGFVWIRRIAAGDGGPRKLVLALAPARRPGLTTAVLAHGRADDAPLVRDPCLDRRCARDGRGGRRRPNRVLTRWERPLEESAALAAALWVAAIMAAIVGTWWMLRILARDR